MTINTFYPTAESKCFNDFSAQIATIKYKIALTAVGGAKSLTVPNAFGDGVQAPGNPRIHMLLKTVPGQAVWFAVNATAVVATSSFVLCDEELITLDTCRMVYGGDTVSFITESTTAYVWVGFYAAK